MDAQKLQAIAARDQLWASLRVLLEEITPLAEGELIQTARQQEVMRLLARVVIAELQFRAESAESD